MSSKPRAWRKNLEDGVEAAVIKMRPKEGGDTGKKSGWDFVDDPYKGDRDMFGLSLVSVSSSISWGAQGGTCNLQMVDPASHALSQAAPISESSFPDIGTPCKFGLRNFTYGGVLQRQQFKESQSGRLFDFTLESPAKILDGVQVVVSEFEAGWNVNEQSQYLFGDDLRNYLNAFAFYESYLYGGPACEQEGGMFGGAGSATNEVGMEVDKLLVALKNFTFRPTEQEADTYERSCFGNLLLFTSDSQAQEVSVDFSELEAAVSSKIPHYRVSGPVKSLNGIISDLCDTMQCDYFIQMLELERFYVRYVDDSGNQIIIEGEPWIEEVFPNGEIEVPELKIRIVDKGEVAAGVVKEKVEQKKESNLVISSSVGKEQVDGPQGRLLIGGPASRLVLKRVRGQIDALAVFRKLGGAAFEIAGNVAECYGNPFKQIKISLGQPISAPVRNIGTANNPILVGGGQTMEYTCTAFELRLAFAYGGDTQKAMHNWHGFKAFQVGSGHEPNGFTPSNWPYKYANPALAFQARMGRIAASRCLIDTPLAQQNQAAAAILGTDATSDTKTGDIIFDALTKVANSTYGRLFLIRLPFEPGGINNNLRFIDETETNFEASWEIADGGYRDIGSRPIHDSRFYDSSGKIKSFSAWSGQAIATEFDGFGNFALAQNLDFSALGTDWGSDVTGATAYKASVEKEIRWLTLPFTGPDPLPYALVDTGAAVQFYDSATTEYLGLNTFSQMHFTDPLSGLPMGVYKGVVLDLINYFNTEKADGLNLYQIPPMNLPPDYITVPQESTRYSWGPWYRFARPGGKVEVDVDTNMKPETFGSVATMDAAGFAQVGAGLTDMKAIETGTVELAEEPEFNLGDKFAQTGPYCTNLDIAFNTGGIKTTYKFSTYTPNFGKLTKYNIDRISRITKQQQAFIKSREGPNAPLPTMGTFGTTLGKSKAEDNAAPQGQGGVGGNLAGQVAPENNQGQQNLAAQAGGLAGQA